MIDRSGRRERDVSWQDRILPLAGAVNLRDFGGYGTRDGRRVRRHRLFRSGSLAHLTEDGQRAFHALGVHTICDLRRPEEQAEEPTALPAEAARRVEIPIDPGSAVTMRAELGRGEVSLQQRIDFMVAINRELAREHRADYARMFEALLEIEEGAFLVHCSAGKDRTGFACALILHALGVEEDTVLEDYLVTNAAMDFEGYLLPRLRARYGEDASLPDEEAVMALAGVREEYLRAAWETIEEEFEGVEAYLERAVGLDRHARALLRARFLE